MKMIVPSSRRPSRSKPLSFIKDGDRLSSYYSEINNEGSMTLAEEKQLSAAIQRGDRKSLNTLVEANLKFVVAVCRNYRNRGLPMGDLINEGNLGLIHAAQKFDGNRNFRFISYGVWWIRQGILLALAEQSGIMTIPAGRVGTIHKINKAGRKLEQNLERQPMLGELASEMGMSEKDVTACLHLASKPISLTTPAAGETDGSMEDLLKDQNAPPSDWSAMKHILGQNVKELLGTLDPREERVLTMYYGIGSHDSYTLEEIASHLILTRERIRQIKAQALEKLRHPSRADRLAGLRN